MGKRVETESALQAAQMKLLDIKFEGLITRLEVPLMTSVEEAWLKAAFFAGVSAGLDLDVTMSAPLENNVTPIDAQAK